MTTYRADGQTATRTDPNSNATTDGYDTIGRLLTKVSTGSGGTPSRASLTYTYNRAGMHLSEASTVTGDAANGTAAFASDALGRLTGHTSRLGSSTDQAYGWQNVSNRDSLTIGTGSPTTLTFDAADRITSSGYTHDLDGRMTGQPGQTMVWDSLGRLKEVRNSSTTALISTYTYDALDRLRTVARSGSTIRFRYVGTSTQVSEVVDNGTGTSQLKVGNGWSGERLATWTGSSSNPRYYGTDDHHDVTWLADGTGAVVATLRYDPWGNVAAASGASLPDWRYQGSWNDTATGMYWVVTRWYAPGLGRFVSEDSLLGEPANPDSRHLYAYAGGDPIGGWDPDGRQQPADCTWAPNPGVAMACGAFSLGWAVLAAGGVLVTSALVGYIANSSSRTVAIPLETTQTVRRRFRVVGCWAIGEEQPRVNSFAANAGWCSTMPNIRDLNLDHKSKLYLNRIWVAVMKRARSKLYDLGPCDHSYITSDYYQMEYNNTWNYWNRENRWGWGWNPRPPYRRWCPPSD